MVTSTLLAAVACLLLVSVHSQEDIRVPPDITNPPRADTLYNLRAANVQVQCQANGIPTPTYKWTRDEVLIVPNDLIKYDSQTGVLSIPSFTDREEGVYMCIATNVFDNDQGGRIQAASFSPPLTLLQIRVDRFVKVDDVTVTQTEFSYVKLACSNQGQVVAKDKVYNWYQSQETAQVNLDGGRLYIDQEGNLHFSYLLRKDRSQSFKYMCGYSSISEGIIVLGNSNILNVDEVNNPAALKPQLQYSNTNQKVRIFGTARLECVFSGYDPNPPNIPITLWYDDAGKTISSGGKYSLSSDKRVLTILDVTEEDEKNYYCEAHNTAGNSGKQAVFLDVTSPPIFRVPDGAPKDAIVPENQDVVFHCDARSASNEAPPSAPTWYINGQKTGSHTDQTKFVLADSNRKLTVKHVKKATDILCVQCQVTNHVGTTWGDACLNVILPIRLVDVPPLKVEIKKGDNVDLTITATTDPSQTLNYRWEIKNDTYTGNNHPSYMYYDDNTKKAYINTSDLPDDVYETIGGIYRRVIFHPYETKIVEVEIILEGITPAGAVAAASIDMWIIGLIIGIIFLIIVIIIIIFVICRKQQEGAYNVDKKETGAGLDPEKELKDKGFNDYSRPDYDNYDYPDKKPRGELEYDDVPIGGDDESLGEYGDEDDTHFNEDGSFIGVYQKKPGPPPPQATESTI